MKSKIVKRYGIGGYGTRFAAVEFENGDRVDVRIRGSQDGKLLNHFGDTHPTEETRVGPIKEMAEKLRRSKNPTKRKTKKKTTRKRNASGRFTKKQLAEMRKSFSKIGTVDPSQPTYGKVTRYLDGLSQPLLKQIAGARIKFLSGLARNRVKSVKR